MSESKWPRVYHNGNEDIIGFLSGHRDNPYDGEDPEETQKAIDEVLAMRTRILELEQRLSRTEFLERE